MFGYYDDNSSLYHIKGYTVPLRRTKVYSSIIKRAGISLGGVERIPPSMNILKATFTVNVSTNTRTRARHQENVALTTQGRKKELHLVKYDIVEIASAPANIAPGVETEQVHVADKVCRGC